MDTERLKKIGLFKDMDSEEISRCVEALNGRQLTFCRGEYVMNAGDATADMGIVLSGSVTVESNDIWGNRTILSHVGENGYFAETYACLKDAVMPVDVAANVDCEILLLTVGHLDRFRQENWQPIFIANLLSVSMGKNLALSGRIFHTAPRTIRGKLLSYLSSVSLSSRSREFDIPFDRQQLADYLNVDRTALSKELGKMRDEGLVAFRKNRFVLYTQEDR